MLLCCLRHNVEASCNKHFVVVSREQLTMSLTSNCCHQFAMVRHTCVYCTWLSNRSQHVMKPDIDKEPQFVPIPPPFDAPVIGGLCQNIAITFGMEKLEWCGYPMVKNSEDMFILFDKIHDHDRQTDTARRHSIAWQKL